MLCCLPSSLGPPAVPASRNEYQSIRLQLESETLPPENPGGPPRLFHQLGPADQAAMERRRVAGWSPHVCVDAFMCVYVCVYVCTCICCDAN